MSSNQNEIDALLQEATPDAAEKLRDIADTASDRETQKAAKRALYLLSQKHILPPERASSQPTPNAQRPTPDAEPLRAFASAYDGAGNRLLIFLIPQPNGGNPLLSNILINDEEGIRDYGGTITPRRDVPKHIEGMTGALERGLAIAEIEPDYGRFLLLEARAIHQEQGTMTPSGFLELWPQIGPPHEEYTEPPIYSHFDADTVRNDQSISHNPEKLFELTWFEPWFLAVEEVTPWLFRYIQAMESPIELPESVQTERKEKSLSEATEGLITPDVRAHYVRRLEETADVLRRRDETEAAKIALYHALQLAEDRPVAEVPFARHLVERSWGAAYYMLREEAERRNASQASSGIATLDRA